MPTEIAYFTPLERSGTAQWIDFWNPDLFDGSSHLSRLSQLDQILFRKDPTTWSNGIEVHNPNGVIQASFNMASRGYLLVTIKLSATPTNGVAWITMMIDDQYVGFFAVSDQDVDVPAVVNVAEGTHRVTVIQHRGWWTDPTAHLWFHSITCFEI